MYMVKFILQSSSERNDNICQKCSTKLVGLEPTQMEFTNTGEQRKVHRKSCQEEKCQSGQLNSTAELTSFAVC